MFKRLILVLVAVIFLTGCMPSPITKTKESKTEHNMIVRSLVSSGNTFRINQKIKAAKKGEKTVIAFVGSSVFSEKSDSQVIQKKTCVLIKDFIGKKANLEFFHYGNSSFNSFICNLGLKNIILKQNPDIIFIDYAVYDTSGPESREAFEALVRTCLLHESQPQVVVILNSKSDGQPKQDFMEQTAKYYNLPYINIAEAVQPEISSGRMAKNKFYNDEFTVTEYGQDIIAKILENYLEQSFKERKDKNYTIPAPMYQNNSITNIKYIAAENIQADNFGSYLREKNNKQFFENKIVYMTDTGNSPFIFTLEADNIWLVAPVSSEREDIAEIYINGKKMTEIISKGVSSEDLPNVFKIYSSEKKEKIAVGIKIKDKDEVTDLTQAPSDNEAESFSDVLPQKKLKNFEFWGIAYTNN